MDPLAKINLIWMKIRFSTIICRKSCQRPTEIFLFSKYHCTTLTVELESDVSVCAQLNFFTNKNSFIWLNFTKALCFGPNNLSQIDVERSNFFVSQEKAQGKSKNSVVMNLKVSTNDINTIKVRITMDKFCQIFKMSNIWANRKVLFPKVKVLIFFKLCSVPNKVHIEVTSTLKSNSKRLRGLSKYSLWTLTAFL